MSEIKRMGRNASEDWKDRLDLFSEIMEECMKRVISMTKPNMIDHYTPVPGQARSRARYEVQQVLALFNAVISPYRAEGSLAAALATSFDKLADGWNDRDQKIKTEEEIFKAHVGNMQNLFNTIRESQQTTDAGKEGFLPLPAPVAPAFGAIRVQMPDESERGAVAVAACEHMALKIYFGFMECPDDLDGVDLSTIRVGEGHVRCPACHLVANYDWAQSGNLWHDALKAAKGEKDGREVHDLESQDRREKTCE